MTLGPGVCIFFGPKLAQAAGKCYSSQSRPKIFLPRLRRKSFLTALLSHSLPVMIVFEGLRHFLLAQLSDGDLDEANEGQESERELWIEGEM